MDIGAILFLLAVLLMIALYVARPFFGDTRRLRREDHALSALLAEHDRILSALQELDFDFTLGKIPAEAYPAQRKELIQHGAEVLRQMDAFTPGTVGEKTPEDRLEAAVAERHAMAEKDASPLISDEDIEDQIAKRRSARRDKTAGFCPTCGKPVLQSDIFCPSCGRALK